LGGFAWSAPLVGVRPSLQVPVVQPAQAKAALDSLSNYAKVFHPAFVRASGSALAAAYAKLKADPLPGKCFFRPRTSKANELELVSVSGGRSLPHFRGS
jgi:hypothetical protein